MAKVDRKKWLAKLLADKYAVWPIFEFLKNTKIENKNSGIEKKEKWEQK